MTKTALLASFLFVALTGSCNEKPEKHYSLQAEVISTEPQRGLIIVRHGEIPGLMRAMTMQYEVEDAKEIENLKPGDKITADLVVSESKGRLEKITLASRGDQKTVPSPN
jgi:Cu/Ag efflux protein CusF